MLTITLQSRTGGRNRTHQGKVWNLATAASRHPRGTPAGIRTLSVSLKGKHTNLYTTGVWRKKCLQLRGRALQARLTLCVYAGAMSSLSVAISADQITLGDFSLDPLHAPRLIRTYLSGFRGRISVVEVHDVVWI